jgi:hypothetical protein
VTRRFGQQASDNADYHRREDRLTGVMTEVKGRERSDLDTGEAGDGRSDAPMDVAMEMATTVTPIAAETTGATIFEPMERNENGKRRRRSEASATALAPCDWRTRMERAAQQQSREVAQLHPTIAKMANMLDAQTALQEPQWRVMKTWLEKREEKWDAYHQDDVLWGRGITDMVTRVVATTEGGQREERNADTDRASLEASIHADAKETGGPEKPAERQQSQTGRQPKPKPKPKLNPAPTPGPRTTSTPIAVMTTLQTLARRWETVPPRNQKKPACPAPAPTTASSLADRRIILMRDENVPLFKKMDQEIASAINRALFHQQAPTHILIMNARRNGKGVITAITHQNATAEMALQYHDIIITVVRTVAKGVVDVEENESWERLKIHVVPLVRYMGKGTEGLQKMQEEFEAENEGVAIPGQVWWLANPRTIRDRRQNGEIAASSVVFVVKGNKGAQRLVKKGITWAGEWYRVEAFTNPGPDSRCELCCGWGHIPNKCSRKPTCGYCSGHHRTSDHMCNVVRCTAKQGSLSGHTMEKCPNCKGNHIAFSKRCAKKTEAASAARQSRKTGLAGQASMREVTGANRVALGTRQARGIGDDEGDPMADEEADDTREKEGAKGEVDVIMAETSAEIEIEMGAATSND